MKGRWHLIAYDLEHFDEWIEDLFGELERWVWLWSTPA
jgi:hypothetical protein